MDAADAQARLGRAAYRADLAAQALQSDVQAPDLFIQQRGFGRAVHALAHALEQAHLDAGLQRGQRGADGGGRQVQPPGRGGHAFGFVDRAEGLHLLEREPHGAAGFRCAAGRAARGAWTAAARQDLGQALAQVAPQAGLDGRVVEIGRSLVHAVAGLAQQGPLKAAQRARRAGAAGQLLQCHVVGVVQQRMRVFARQQAQQQLVHVPGGHEGGAAQRAYAHDFRAGQRLDLAIAGPGQQQGLKGRQHGAQHRIRALGALGDSWPHSHDRAKV